MANGNKTGYLDFHCHILPEVDDGSKSWEMTREMLEMSHRQGVRTMVATSHFYPGETKTDGARFRALCEKAGELAKEIDGGMEILPGNEVFYQPGVVRFLKEKKALSMADSRYVLLEFHPMASRRDVEQGARELLEAGYAPVVAHVERVAVLMGDEDLSERLLEMGTYFQANAGSLMGGIFDKRTKQLKRWIKAGKLHFLGSDCHNTGSRPPLMGDAVRQLEKSLPEECLRRLLCDNPRLFLEKKYI